MNESENGSICVLFSYYTATLYLSKGVAAGSKEQFLTITSLPLFISTAILCLIFHLPAVWLWRKEAN